MKEQLNAIKKLDRLKECLALYNTPLFVVGDMDMLINKQNATFISATSSPEEFVILNGQTPLWLSEINSKENEKANILVIDDLEETDVQKQELFLSILKHQEVSTQPLPENLKIILHAKERCIISEKVRSLVLYIEI